MKLKQFIEKLSSASQKDMECEVKIFDVSTGNFFTPGADKSSQFEFGKMINSDDYYIFYDTERLYLNQ